MAVNSISWNTLEGNDSFDTAGPFIDETEEVESELERFERGQVDQMAAQIIIQSWLAQQGENLIEQG